MCTTAHMKRQRNWCSGLARQWPHPSMPLVWSLCQTRQGQLRHREDQLESQVAWITVSQRKGLSPTMSRNVFLVVHSTVTRLFMSQPYYQMPQELIHCSLPHSHIRWNQCPVHNISSPLCELENLTVLDKTREKTWKLGQCQMTEGHSPSPFLLFW